VLLPARNTLIRRATDLGENPPQTLTDKPDSTMLPAKIYPLKPCEGDQLMAPPDFTKYDFTKLFDVKALLEIQRKNIEAVSEANKLAFEGFQAAGQRQAAILSQIVEDTSSIVKEITAEKTPEEKMTRQAELVKNAYEKSVTNWRELTDIIASPARRRPTSSTAASHHP